MSRELDIRISKMLGFFITVNDGEHIEWDGREPRSLPLYSTDHTAVRLVENEIERRGLEEKYVEALGDIVTTTDSITADIIALAHTSEMLLLWRILRATPEQRCVAALRAVGGREGE